MNFMMTILLGINLNFIAINSAPALTQSQVKIIENRLDAPDKVVKYFSKFKYESRKKGFQYYIISPAVFLNTQSGDCKDYANFCNEIGIIHKIESKLFCIWPGNHRDGHVFCVWNIDGKLYPLCNVTCLEQKKSVSFDNMKQILDFYQKKMQWKKIDDWWEAKVFNNQYIPYKQATINELQKRIQYFKSELENVKWISVK